MISFESVSFDAEKFKLNLVLMEERIAKKLSVQGSKAEATTVNCSNFLKFF